jgi:molybdopterin-containing oxidoreductase family membrane subunit
MNRATGPYWWAYACMMTCNVISPQLMWFKKIRRNLVVTFILSIIVNIGMWFERFVIIVTSLHRDFLTSSWTQFHPTYVDMGVFVGTIGLFFVLYLLYSRTFPVLALNEVKTILRATGEYGVKNANHFSHEGHSDVIENDHSKSISEDINLDINEDSSNEEIGEEEDSSNNEANDELDDDAEDKKSND